MTLLLFGENKTTYLVCSFVLTFGMLKIHMKARTEFPHVWGEFKNLSFGLNMARNQVSCVLVLQLLSYATSTKRRWINCEITDFVKK